MIVYVVACDLNGIDIAAVCTKPDLAAEVARKHGEDHPCVVLEFEADVLPAGVSVRDQHRA
jgi:hypothetical protein